MSRSNGYPPCSQRESLDGMNRSLTTDGEGGRVAWERTGVVRHAMPLLNLQLFNHLYVLFAYSTLYTLEDDNFLKWVAVKQL